MWSLVVDMAVSKISPRELIKREFGIDLPISGGGGSSIDDAIIIDKDYPDWADVEYTFLHLINQFFGRTWKLVKSTLIEKDGRKFEQMKFEIEGDEENYYNYYFDITNHMNAGVTLFVDHKLLQSILPKTKGSRRG